MVAPVSTLQSKSSKPLPGHALFRHLFVPGLLVLSVVSWIYDAEASQALKAARLGLDHTTAAVLLSIACIWVAEQLYPANPEWNYNLAANPVRAMNRFARDFFYATLVTVVSALLVGFTSTRLHAALDGRGLLGGALWPSHAPLVVRILLAFFLVELGSYAYHRAAHRVELLWRLHSAHHVVTELTAVKALRTHPADNVLFCVARTAPLLALGAGAEELVAAAYFGGILSVLAHANLDVSAWGLGWVINLPQFHRVHHSSELEESRSNFGCHTVLWDRIFGTFRAAPQGQLELGVKPVGPRSLWQELGWPLYRSVS